MAPKAEKAPAKKTTAKKTTNDKKKRIKCVKTMEQAICLVR